MEKVYYFEELCWYFKLFPNNPGGMADIGKFVHKWWLTGSKGGNLFEEWNVKDEE